MFMYRATKPVAERIRRSGQTHVSQLGGEQSPLCHLPGVAIRYRSKCSDDNACDQKVSFTLVPVQL